MPAPPSEPSVSRRWTVSDDEPEAQAGVGTATLAPPASPWTVDPGRAVAPPPPTEEEPRSDLHRRAAEAYCNELLPSEAVGAAVEVALWSDGDSDAELLRAVRTTAAERVTGDAKPRGLREALAVEHENACDATPARLAERANGTLPEHDQRELEQHLGDCLSCQAAELREERATRAFAAALLSDGSGAAPAAASPDPSAGGDASSRWTPGAEVIAGAAAVSAGLPPAPAPIARRRRRALLAGAGTIIAAAVVAVVLIAGNAKHHRGTTPQAAAPVTPTQTQTATTPAPAHHRHVATHRVRHTTTTRTHKAAAHKKTTHKTTHKSKPSTPVSQPSTPVVYTPPHRTAPVVVPQSSTPVVTHSSTPPPATSVTSVSQSSLPATSAPQSGVGGSSK
jgi:hypothetical protein